VLGGLAAHAAAGGRHSGFSAGDVSVQDAGAQLAVELLQVDDGMRVLDACAAPGVKTRNWPRSPMTSPSTRSKSTPRVASGSRRTCAARGRASTRSSPARRRRGAAGALRQAALSANPARRALHRLRHRAPAPGHPLATPAADVAQLATVQARLLDALWPLLEPGW